jgi:hypothetical protein
MTRARKRKMEDLQHDDAQWIKMCCVDGAMGLCCGQYGVSDVRRRRRTRSGGNEYILIRMRG